MATEVLPPPVGERNGEEPAPRRWRARPAGGHVLVVLTGIVALVGNIVVLRAMDDRQEVAVLAAPLEAGAALATADLAWTMIGADDPVLERLVRRAMLPGLRDHVAAYPLAAGAVLRTSDLREPTTGGRRAMSVPVSAAHAVSGALQPGDRVDVIAVADQRATFVVTAVEVLAVAGRGGGALAVRDDFAVTLAVSPEEALALAQALRAEGLEVVRSTGAEPVR